MGTANWVRDYVPRFAELAAPLTDLLSIKRKFTWNTAAQEAFDKLKEALAQPLKLSRPDPNLPYCLQVDASATGMAGVLFQLGENGERRIISCASAKFTQTETKYHINEQETLAAVWAIKRYSAYLEHRKFTLYTDSRALTWLERFKDEKAKLTRWALMLQGYQFEIIHVPGRLNELPDHLSRYPAEEPTEPQPTDDSRMYATLNQIDDHLPLEEFIRQTQLEEEECRNDMARLAGIMRNGPEGREEEEILAVYDIRDGVIWHKTQDLSRLYVPTTARNRVLREYHDGVLAGHPGRDETIRQISARYFWPGMNRDVVEYVKTCAMCASTKRGVLQPAAPLRPQSAAEPWDTISIDILGPYPKTVKGHQYVIIVEDIFSKWVEAAATPDGRVGTLLNFLESHVFARWGYPRVIISDNGSGFHSDAWIRAMERHHITPRYSPVYHQRSNPVERRVQELKKILRTRSDPHRPNRWDLALNDALFCLRTRANAATGTTPSELLLGYCLRRPGEIRRGEEADRPEARQDAEVRRQRIEKARRRQVTYTRKVFPEERRSQVQLQRGDAVLCKEPGPRGHPFPHVWTGPWPVTEVLGDNSYQIEKAGKLVPFHIDDLRAAVRVREGPVMMPPPAIGGNPPDPPDPPDPMPGPSSQEREAIHLPPNRERSPEAERRCHPGDAPASSQPGRANSRAPHQREEEDRFRGPEGPNPASSSTPEEAQAEPPTPEPPAPPPPAGVPMPTPRRRRRRARIVVVEGPSPDNR